MNGANQEHILTWNSIHSPRYYTMALAVDPANDRLYFHDGYDIKYTNTSRPITGKVYNALRLSWQWFLHPHGLAVKEEFIYWGDDYSYRAVYRANKTSSNSAQKLMSGIHPVDLHVYHNNSDIPGNVFVSYYRGISRHPCLRSDIVFFAREIESFVSVSKTFYRTCHKHGCHEIPLFENVTMN